FNSPSPRILMSALALLMMPALTSTSGVTSFCPSSAMRSRFTTSYPTRKMLWKPRFGKRRCNGIWPPSKPRIMREPERDRCPLCPRPEVLPMPEPMPRPTRFLFSLALRGDLNVDKFMCVSYSFALRARWPRLSLYDLDQVRHFFHHAADGRRIYPLHYLVQP